MTVTRLPGSTFRVTGTVDAQNIYGAKLRSAYVCVVRYDGGDNWTSLEPCGLVNY